MEREYCRNHIEPRGRERFSSDITESSLLEYQASRSALGLSNRTVNILVGIIRKIMLYAAAKGWTGSATMKYPKLREAKRHHAFLTPDEYSRLVSRIENPLTRARVVFARHTGLRPAELAWLSWADVDLEGGTVKVQGKAGWKPKTDEERVIPLNDTASDILTTLYKVRKGPWVFSRGQRPVLDIKKALLTAAEGAGIHKRVSPNMLRHTFATHALQAGGTSRRYRRFLGTKS